MWPIFRRRFITPRFRPTPEHTITGRLTETYYFLECGPGAEMELDGNRVAVSPGMAVIIRPGVRHRALGRMKVLIFVLPKFDPEDEWFD